MKDLIFFIIVSPHLLCAAAHSPVPSKKTLELAVKLQNQHIAPSAIAALPKEEQQEVFDQYCLLHRKTLAQILHNELHDVEHNSTKALI